MTHRLPVVALGLLLAGCTVVRVEYEPLADGGAEPAGEIQFLAFRDDSPKRLTPGYTLTVVKNWAIVGTYESSASQATSIGDLKPGTYDVSIRGRGIDTQSTNVKVRPGQATVIQLMVRNARRAARANDLAIGAGKAVLYTVGAVAYAIVYVFLESCDGDDDDDDDDDLCFQCGRSSCSGHHEKKKRSAPAGPVSNYRKK